jgi:putative Holliday junction resolvase
VSRLLGLDVGERRIGIAVGDTEAGSVRALTTLTRGTVERDAAALRRLATEQHATELVVGAPLDATGGPTAQSERIRAWSDAVAPLVGLPFSWRDERHTSQSAEARLGRLERGRAGGAPSAAARRAHRSRVDREAAAAIVQAELDARAEAQR